MRSLLLLFLTISTCLVAAQTVRQTGTDELNADVFLGYDTLGAIYSMSDQVLVKQYGGQRWQYKNLQLGRITKVDLQNPLKIVLFYQDFNTVILVDNQLNETANINLNDADNPIVPSAIGLAAGNRLWIYNNLDMKMGLYDFNKRSFKSLAIPFTNNVKFYHSDYNEFEWIDEQWNWYRCDVYGKILSLGKTPICDQVQWISNDNLLYFQHGEMFSFSRTDKKSTLLPIEEKTFKNFICKDQILSIFTDHRIINYKITIP